MKRMRILFIGGFIAGLCYSGNPALLQAETTFVTIGSGELTGVYFPTGLTIARMLNGKRDVYGIRATVESTRGSVFNINAITAGYLEFGLVQSDKQYEAVKGLAEWALTGPQKQLYAVFSLHRETVNLVAAVDSGIETIADLKGKRVNLGNPGAGQYQNAVDALEAAGLNPKRDMYSVKVKATEASTLLQDNRIDAFFCTVGHPSEILRQATSGARRVRFIPITGPDINQLIADKPYYTHTTVPVGQFYPEAEDAAKVETFGVIATLCTAASTPVDVVYAITKEIFDNLEEFRGQHPSLENLSRSDMLKGLTAPLHPGAMAFFKEVGLVK